MVLAPLKIHFVQPVMFDRLSFGLVTVPDETP